MPDLSDASETVGRVFCKGPSKTWEALQKLEAGDCSCGYALAIIQGEATAMLAEAMEDKATP